MGPGLHNQIAALPLTGTVMDLHRYTRGGRLYCNSDSREPIWVADLCKTAAEPDVIPIRRQLTPPPLSQNFFISANKRDFHQLNVIDFWDSPHDEVSQALLAVRPDLPALAIHWDKEPHPVLHYAYSERMLLSHPLRRRAAGQTLIEGAFYAFPPEAPSPVSANLMQWWSELSGGA